jgi:hypothetical protein
VLLDDTLYEYYGASDQWCCVATANIHELVDFVKENTVVKTQRNGFIKPEMAKI